MDLITYITQAPLVFMFIFCRISALIMVMPVFSAKYIPVKIKLTLALVISFMIYLNYQTLVYDSELLSVKTAAVVFYQLFIGICIGLWFQFLLNVFIHGAQIIAMQMGLGFAALNDPATGISVPTLSQFYLTAVTLMFVSSNLHLFLIEIVSDSFVVIPLLEPSFTLAKLEVFSEAMAWLFESSLKIALPIIAMLLMANVTLAILTRAAPQLNVFSIGFPMIMILGLFFIWMTLPAFLDHYYVLLDQHSLGLLEAMGLSYV